MTAVFHPDGTLAAGPLELDLTPERAGWGYSGLKVLTLAPGETWTLGTDQDEAIVLPLAGGLSAQVDGGAFVLEGRREVFTSVIDFLYLPRECRAARKSTRLNSSHVANSYAVFRLKTQRQAVRVRGGEEEHVERAYKLP